MRDVEVFVPTSDGRKIYCLQNGKITDDVVLVAPGHGMHILSTALPREISRFFAPKGISVMRMNFYGGSDNPRRLSDAGFTLAKQVYDLQKVIAYLRERGAKHVHVAAHSLAAYVAIQAAGRDFAAESEGISSIILLDGADPHNNPIKPTNPDVQRLGEFFIQKNGAGTVMAASYMDSLMNLDLTSAIKGWKTPTLILGAAESVIAEAAAAYEKLLAPYGKRQMVPGAQHFFTNDDTAVDTMLSFMLKWVKSGYQQLRQADS